MLRIVALNNNENNIEYDTSVNEIQIAKEAQEAIAESEYIRALSLLSQGDKTLASSLFTQLLNTQVLNEISKEDTKLRSIQFNCYKNLAFINEDSGDLNCAITHYLLATQIDSTDVNVVYRMGQLSLKLQQYELAEYAFNLCLQRNKKHWAAANGVLSIHIKQNNILAAYGVAYNLIVNHNHLSTLAKHTIQDIICRFSTFLPICEILYGKIPKTIKTTSSNNIIFNTTEIPPSSNDNDNSIVSKKKLSGIIDENKRNFYIIGKILLLLLTEDDDYHLNLINILNIDEIFENKTQNSKSSDSNTSPKSVDIPSVTTATTKEIELSSNIAIGGGDCCDDISESFIDEPIQNQNNDEVNTDNNDAVGKSKVRRRCSDLKLLEQWGWHKNRKYSSRKKVQTERATDADLSLSAFLKKTFLKSMEISFDETPTIHVTKNQDEFQCNVCNKLATSLDEFEKLTMNEFNSFLESIRKNRIDLLSINFIWLKTLSKMWNYVIPLELKQLYCKLYSKHIEFFGSPRWDMLEIDDNYDTLNMTLMYLELQIAILPQNLDNLPQLWINSLQMYSFLFSTTLNASDNCANSAVVRFLNLEFLKFSIHDDTKGCLEQLEQLIEILETESNEFIIHLPNMNNGCISKVNLIKLHGNIERKTKLKQIPILYKNEKWYELCENLKEQLRDKQNHYNDLEDYKNINELLLLSLWKLREFGDCLICAESYLQYATQSYLQETTTISSSSGSNWINDVSITISYIEAIIINEGIEIVAILKENYSRLIQNLVNLLILQFDEEIEKKPRNEDELKIRKSWIILHYLLLREEAKSQQQQQQQQHKQPLLPQNSDEDDVDDLPISFQLLFTAHEHIGNKKQSCTNDNGEFLQYIMKSIVPNLHAPIYTTCRNHAMEYIEQLTFCMYGFPPKKARSRHLEDHNSKLLDLTWENSIDIFDAFAPETLPEFNSYKVESITSDMEQFLIKILTLLPTHYDFSAGIANVKGFISGLLDKLEVNGNRQHQQSLPFKIQNIYYLLADYYFKSRDFAKAITFYLNDLANNCKRFDSWAGISLSKASIIETKLNGYTELDAMQFIGECEEVIRCFDKCISLVQNHILIWIEYGSFAYCISSFCSRALRKCSTNNRLLLQEKRQRTLNIASDCFTVAATLQGSDPLTCNESNEEKWLCQYMLGKIAEKKQDTPNVYLNYYLTAANYLYECNATYPIKLNHNNPTTLSVEALEVFYRTNASIAKYLEQNVEITRDIGNLFKGVLKQLSNSPFAFNKAKIDGNCLYNIKRKSMDVQNLDSPANKRIMNEELFPVNSKTVRELLPEENLPIPVIETISSSNSTSSLSNFNSDSDNSDDNEISSGSCRSTDLDLIYKKVVKNLEECAIRFPEHYKSIYRLISFHMNGPKKIQSVKISEDLLLHHYQTKVGNRIDGLFYDRKTNNIFNGVWRIPSSEIDRPGSFSAHLVKCVDILLRLLSRQLNYKFLVDLVLQLHKSPDNDKRYIVDSERMQLCESAIKYSQDVLRKKLWEFEQDNNNDMEKVNLLVEIYKIQKKCYKYLMRKDTWFSQIFEDVYISYIRNKVENLPTNLNFTDLAIKLCHHEINKTKMIEKQTKQQSQAQAININPSPYIPVTMSNNSNILNTQIMPTDLIHSQNQFNNLLNKIVPNFVSTITTAAATTTTTRTNPHLFGSNILDPHSRVPSILANAQQMFSEISQQNPTNYFNEIPNNFINSVAQFTGTNTNVTQLFASSTSTTNIVDLNSKDNDICPS